MKFLHGLGDAAQFRQVLSRLVREWEHVAFFVWCRPLKGVFLADLATIVAAEVPHDKLIDVPWLPCERTYPDRPGTKTVRALEETFRLDSKPIDVWTPPPIPAAIQAWAGEFKRSRGPFVLIHPNGDQVAGEKDWPSDKTASVVAAVERVGKRPIVLGGQPPWSEPPFLAAQTDRLSLADPIWNGEPNALKLFALIQEADMLVGCDSGPIHLGQWSNTPTLAIWTKHHPLHYCDDHGPIEHFLPKDVAALGDADYFEKRYKHVVADDPWQAAIARIEGRESKPIVGARKVVLKGKHAVGDAVVMSGALESLHRAHPGKFLTDVETCSNDIYSHNPRVTPIERGPDVEVVEMDYGVESGLMRPIHFMQEFCESLGRKLGVEIPLAVNRPQIHFSEDEKRWIGRVQEIVGKDVPYAVIAAGGKVKWHDGQGKTRNCFTTKIHDPSFWQAIVDHYQGRLTFVQIGERNADSFHPVLKNVIDQVNQTPMRVLIRLARHAKIGMGPSTLLQHVCAGTETPYLLVDSAREPEPWMSYPLQTSLVPHGRYRCGGKAACGKVAVEDCLYPWKHENRTTTSCIASIRPEDAIRAIDAMIFGNFV